jgi:hypothetical protein
MIPCLLSLDRFSNLNILAFLLEVLGLYLKKKEKEKKSHANDSPHLNMMLDCQG